MTLFPMRQQTMIGRRMFIQREVGRLVDNLYLKKNLMPRYAQTGRLKGNAQLQKAEWPLSFHRLHFQDTGDKEIATSLLL